MKKKNLLSWILDFAGRRRLYFIGSVFMEKLFQEIQSNLLLKKVKLSGLCSMEK